jgi:putative inorganic carbon (hco3(-)) transporter
VSGLLSNRMMVRPRRPVSDFGWTLVFGGLGALSLGWLLTFSIQATCAVVLVVLVIALYQNDRSWGIVAMFLLWFAAPLLRRIFALLTGPIENDPLSLAPFLATAAIAAIELARVHVPSGVRRVLLLAAAGFAIGLPAGLLAGPRAAIYAFVAYLAAVAGAVLGFSERGSLRDSNLRRVLLVAIPVIAAYAIAQHYLPFPIWDRAWLDETEFSSIGDVTRQEEIRAFSSLNSPGALAPLLGLTLLCYMTVFRHRAISAAAAALTLVALSVTFVRSAWVSLIVAGLAHVIASRGRSARLVLGVAVVAVAAGLALSPVSNTARDVSNRFTSLVNPEADVSATERATSFSQLMPIAIEAPLGHGLGTAGEPTKISGQSDLRAPDNGYLSLMYQVGPIGFLLVLAALAFSLRAAWNGARDTAPGQDLRLLLFAILVYMLVQLTSGDSFYGSHGVIVWFVCGQVLGYQFRWRKPPRRAGRGTRIASR